LPCLPLNIFLLLLYLTTREEKYPKMIKYPIVPAGHTPLFNFKFNVGYRFVQLKVLLFIKSLYGSYNFRCAFIPVYVMIGINYLVPLAVKQPKGIAMFKQESINVPVLGIIENMAYFTPDELPDNKYYIFGKEGAKNLAEDLDVPFLGEVPLVQSIREAGDYGRPAALQTATPLETAFEELARNVVQETVSRNENLPPTEAIKITTMAGCSAVKKK
jgi:hypothetical protein